MNKHEIIAHLNADKLRGNTALGWAQINAPKAYAEYHANKKQHQTIREYFHDLEFETLCSVDNERELMIANFDLRERELQLKEKKK